jgi:hypothetical protein
MKRPVIATAMGLCLVSLAAIASADTLIMRDGTRVEGTIVGIVLRTITFRHADGVARRYFTSQVERVEFFSADRANPLAASGRRLEAPAGTELTIGTTEMIDSRSSGPDQVFSAIVERDATGLSGRVIVPRGASAQLIIRQVSTDGATGGPEMALDIQSITIEGRRYLVSATDLPVDSGAGLGTYKGKGKAEPIAAGAALGTVVGAIAGGGKAAAPAPGMPVGTELRTHGHDVKVPAETAITFRLDKSVTLQAAP